MGWYDTVKVSEPNIRGADYGAVVALNSSANDKFTKALEGIGNIFSEPERMKQAAIKDYASAVDHNTKALDSFTDRQTKSQTSDAINQYNNEVSKIKASGLPIDQQMKQIQSISLGDSNSLADFNVLNQNKTSIDNELNNRLEKEAAMKQAKEFHDDTVELQKEQNRIANKRYDEEKKNSISTKLSKAAAYNNSYLNSSEIQSEESKKLVGKEHTKEDDAKIAEKINIATKGDTSLDQYGNNIEFANKFSNNPTSETGIDNSYVSRGSKTKTVVGPDGKESEVPLTVNDISKEIVRLNDLGYTYKESASGDPYKVADKNSAEVRNLEDVDRKIKILEIDRKMMNPNLTKDDYSDLVKEQKKLADSMKTENITKATNRANSYYNDASAEFTPTVDKFITEYVPKDDKKIFTEEKARIKSELLADKNVNPEDAELAAAEGASALVKKNTENKKEYDKKITEKAKIAYENSTEKEKESLKLAKEKLDGFKGMYDSLTKANSNASSSEKDDALFEYTRAQKEYDEFVSSHLNSKASKY